MSARINGSFGKLTTHGTFFLLLLYFIWTFIDLILHELLINFLISFLFFELTLHELLINFLISFLFCKWNVQELLITSLISS
jgi:hypothetical protein